MRLFFLFIVSSLISGAAVQAAEAWPKWYIGVSGDVTSLSDAHSNGGTFGKAKNYDTGWGVNGALGYRPGLQAMNGWLEPLRVELEIGYHRNGFGRFESTGGLTASGGGDYSSIAYMANAFYDIGDWRGFTPYLGAGVGVVQTMLDVSNAAFSVDDSDAVPGYQFMTGIYYSPESMPLTSWGVGYRYMTALDPEYTTATGAGAAIDYDAHHFELGARFRF